MEVAVPHALPKYAVQEEVIDRTKLNTDVQLCRLGYQLRWREHRLRNQSSDFRQCNFPIPKFPESQYVSVPPQTDLDMETRIRRCQMEISRVMDTVDSVRSNLTKEEMAAVKGLRRKPIVILPSDKGGEFCAINSVQYTEAGLKHLSDTKFYKEIKKISASTIENKTNAVWKKVSREGGLSRS